MTPGGQSCAYRADVPTVPHSDASMRATPDILERPAQDTRDDERAAPDTPYDVILWNDPVTLMHVVVRALEKVFGYPAEVARRLMMAAHLDGKAVVWTGGRDEAVRHCLELGAHGLQATVRRAG